MILLILVQIAQENNPTLKNYYVRSEFLIKKVRALDPDLALSTYLFTRFPYYKNITLKEKDNNISLYEVGFSIGSKETHDQGMEYLTFTVEEVEKF